MLMDQISYRKVCFDTTYTTYKLLFRYSLVLHEVSFDEFRQIQEHGMKFLLYEIYVGTLYLASGLSEYS